MWHNPPRRDEAACRAAGAVSRSRGSPSGSAAIDRASTWGQRFPALPVSFLINHNGEKE